MSLYSVLLLASFATSSALGYNGQIVLNPQQYPNEAAHRIEDRYDFPWPIKDVAIIGAGVSGLATYRVLADSGKFNRIRIFERDSVVGGNWHYTEEKPDYVPVELGRTEAWWTGDYTPSNRSTGHVTYDATQNETKREELERERKRFRQPKPVWWTLRSNTPRVQQQVPDFPWPPHEPWASHWSSVQRYLRGFASWLGVNKGDEAEGREGVIEFDTRVEQVEKRWIEGKHKGWTLTLRKFTEKSGRYEDEFWTEVSCFLYDRPGRIELNPSTSMRLSLRQVASTSRTSRQSRVSRSGRRSFRTRCTIRASTDARTASRERRCSSWAPLLARRVSQPISTR